MLLWKFLLSSLLVVATVQQCQPQFILPNTLQGTMSIYLDSVELTTFTSQQSQTVASYTYQYSSNVFTGTPTALLCIYHITQLLAVYPFKIMHRSIIFSAAVSIIAPWG